MIVCDYQLSRGATGVDAIERLRSAFPISSTSPIPARVISGDASSPLCEVGSRVVQAGESGEVSRGAGRRLRAATPGRVLINRDCSAIAGCRKRRQREAALLTSACPPAIAYSRVGTGTPSAVPSSSNFPASHLGSESGLIAQSYRAFSHSAADFMVVPPCIAAAETRIDFAARRQSLFFGQTER